MKRIFFIKKGTQLVTMFCSQSQKSSFIAIFSKLQRWNFFVISSKFWRADQQLSCDFRKYYHETLCFEYYTKNTYCYEIRLTVINFNRRWRWSLLFSRRQRLPIAFFDSNKNLYLFDFRTKKSKKYIFDLEFFNSNAPET